MVLGPEQGANVPVERKVRLLRALDGFGHFRVCGMHHITHLASNVLLLGGQSSNVLIDARISLRGTHTSSVSPPGTST